MILSLWAIKKTGHELDLACGLSADSQLMSGRLCEKEIKTRIRKAFATRGRWRDKAKRKGLLVLVVFPCPYHVAPVLW